MSEGKSTNKNKDDAYDSIFKKFLENKDLLKSES